MAWLAKLLIDGINSGQVIFKSCCLLPLDLNFMPDAGLVSSYSLSLCMPVFNILSILLNSGIISENKFRKILYP